MSFLLGASSLYPVTLEGLLQSVMCEEKPIREASMGAIYYEKNDAYVFRAPRAPGDFGPTKLSEDSHLVSRLILSCFEKSVANIMEIRNTQPFTREVNGRLHSFIFDGKFPDVYELDLAMDQYSPIGETDGEYIFCWLLERVNNLEGPRYWEQKMELLTSLGSHLSSLGPANFLYSDSFCLYAYASTRSGDNDAYSPGLYYNLLDFRQLSGSKLCAELTTESPSNQAKNLILVASMPIGISNWIAFEKNQLIVFENGKVTHA